MSPEAGTAHGLPEQMEVFRRNAKEFFEARKNHVDSITALCQQQCKLNENSAAFYEKLMLLDGGAIVFSVTLLGSRNSTVAVNPHAIFWLITPAWILLLLSMYFCMHCMARYHRMNNLLVLQTSKLSNNYYLQLTGVTAQKMFGSVPTALDVDVKDTGALVESLLCQGVKDGKDADEAFSKANAITKVLEVQGAASVGCAMLSIVLLCVFAVKNLIPH